MNQEGTAEHFFELGKYHSNLKNARNAIGNYKKAVEIDPSFYQAWSNMGAEYFQLKEFDSAVDACKRAIEAKNDDPHAWLTLAASFFQTGDDGRALFCFQQAARFGSQKATKFLENAKKLGDKLLSAKPVNVFKEIIKKKEADKVKAESGPAPGVITLDPSDHGKYIENLAGFLLQLGSHLQKSTGGVISFLELFARVKKDLASFTGTPADVLEALAYLEEHSLIVGTRTLEGTNFTVVEFVPVDFTPDVQHVLNLASETGMLTVDEVAKRTAWDEFRIVRAIEVLEEKGVARKTTTYKDGTRWHFPGLNLKLADEKKGEKAAPAKPTRSTSSR
nr:tetratricopeptide repeat protein [Candidatus Sigynarchaeum springense]